MKKKFSQITIAVVCGVFGFLVTYEMKLLSNNNQYTNETEISTELQALTKSQEELLNRQTELKNQLQKYESNATNQVEIKKQIISQLSESKILIGTVDVKGSGITIQIIPEGNAFTDDASSTYLKEEELNYLVNELRFAGAEAIAINNTRLTSQTSIKTTNDNFIVINGQIISTRSTIEIKAIGDKVKLYSALNFAGTLEYGVLDLYRIDIKPVDLVSIPKYNLTYRTQYFK